jgi:hypothetical protein
VEEYDVGGVVTSNIPCGVSVFDSGEVRWVQRKDVVDGF